jgi:hypothetical protein
MTVIGGGAVIRKVVDLKAEFSAGRWELIGGNDTESQYDLDHIAPHCCQQQSETGFFNTVVGPGVCLPLPSDSASRQTPFFAVRLRVPVIKVSTGTSTRPVTLRFTFALSLPGSQHQVMTLPRHA